MKTPPITMDDIYRRENVDFGPYDWVNPADVFIAGADAIKEQNRLHWLAKAARRDDTSWEQCSCAEEYILTDYLSSHLTRVRLQHNFSDAPYTAPVSPDAYARATLYLIRTFGISYPATILGVHREYITEDYAPLCLKIMQNEFNDETCDFISDIIRSYILDTFWHAVAAKGGTYAQIFSKDDKAFLEFLLQRPPKATPYYLY